MIALNDHLEVPGRTTIAGVPEGHDALLLAEAGAERLVLHVCRDDARLQALSDAIGFFAPALETLSLPAWDCLPYDRVSPNADIVARRLAALTRLADAPPEIGVVLTTVAAILQRIPPREVFKDAMLAGKVGEPIAQEEFQNYFVHNGYRRAATVREPGEYALRGGIIDVYPPGVADPFRLDFFGDELESVRAFDAMTQRSSEKLDGFVLGPVSEVMLDDDAVDRFREAYRRMFGPPAGNDPLYEAVSARRRHAGMEHWLALFHERLETLFDYLPAAAVTLDHQADEASAARQELIAEHYEARREMLPKTQRDAEREEVAVYKPTPPEMLYLAPDEWSECLAARPIAAFHAFDAPETAGSVVDAGGRRVRDFAEARHRQDVNLFDVVRDRLASETDRHILVFGHSAGSRDRLGGLLQEHGVTGAVTVKSWAEALEQPAGTVLLAALDIDHGFETDACLAISEQDILGDRIARPSRGRRRAEQFITEVSSLSEGDFVVHIDHGIGQYDRLEAIDVLGAPHDCLTVHYAGGDRLYVPVENIDVLSRYGSEQSEAQLDRLGAPAWQARKARVKERIRDIAQSLLKTAAERALRQGERLVPEEAGAYGEFCAAFAWAETEDQMRAIEDVVGDLASGRPMDRLICGDVGFGKTEIALRATFIAAMEGRQVAIVVPTTLLARQHYHTFVERFQGLPLNVEQLSRLVAQRKSAEIKAGLADGSVDIVIGTHTLLGKSIEFANLGLLVVDEEQHFGVAQKERLKQLRTDVHVLTLTATPIPRTLQMALTGVKEMSIIASPPVDRLAVRTFVLPYDPVVVREAILRERFRGGQTFYVCPRITDLARMHERITELIPEIKIAVAHGRMATKELEEVMTGFVDGAYDVLLCTQIIEAGLDIPTANTMIVHRADRFGLGQLYQLRGRIGRSKARAYAYLTLPPGHAPSPAAERRLEVMQALDTLGAGFSLASHDLDIRGAGNLLGEEQSGHIREVGVELYQHLLEETVAELRGTDDGSKAEEGWTPQIAIGTSVLIPEPYVADLSVRLGLYRRLSQLVDPAEIEAFAAELIDRFGPLPEEVENLLEVIAIKRLCRQAGVEKIDAGPKGATLAFRNNTPPNLDRLIGFIQQRPDAIKLRPKDQTLVYMEDWEGPQTRLKGVHRLMAELAAMNN